MTTKRPGIVAVVASVLAAATFTASASAATGTLSIDSVGGQLVKKGKVAAPVSGAVPVTGRASVEGASSDAPAPLVADAGDSAFVRAGDRAALLGTGFGGTEPYTFAWTAAAGTIVEGADSPTALLDTTGLAVGTYSVSLRVTDAAGTSATDTVKVVVSELRTATLLDESRNDSTPGVLSAGAPGTLAFPFEVAPGTSAIDIVASWTVPTNDYDLVLLDPTGAERLSVGGSPPATSEVMHFVGLTPGTWTARVDKFATITDTVRVLVTGEVAGADPRPVVDSGGPYRFVIGTPQTLDGTVTGGAAPVAAGWDLDGDGAFESSGTDLTASLPQGRHIVTLKATDAGGLERRETTSVLIADPARLAEENTAITVIGVADSGINPYHSEFSAATYPDPDVLAVTGNFTRHPSEYISGYPADATALPITLGQGYFPEQDAALWSTATIEGNRLYWIPGTKIIGAIDSDVSTGASSGDDPHPILDDNGHGSGSASVSTGNRYGYCPTCLLVVVEGLEEGILTAYPWIDITSHSFGYVYGIPAGVLAGVNEATKAAAERGQTVLFAAGNGIGNAFDVPIATYGSDQTGPDWNITVGAIRRDNQRGIIGDGIPVHLSSWGDGNLPSACRTGTVGQCAFGGTSAATPYTAGVFGTVLTEIRDVLGDPTVGQQPGQVVASGTPVEASTYLADGALTRGELRDAVLKTAEALEGEASVFPVPATAPYNSSTNVLIEGYGAATPDSAQRAIDVLLGEAVTPDRTYEDQFFALDRQVRDTLYGGWDRDGDGAEDNEGFTGGPAVLALTPTSLTTVEGMLGVLDRAAALSGASSPMSTVAETTAGGEPSTWFLHRRYAGDPGTATVCGAHSNELYLDRSDSAGDLEPCFESRVTSVVAAYRPLGIWASTGVLDESLPAGSDVTVDLYVAAEAPSVIRPTGVLVATDREIGEGAAGLAPVVGSGPGPGSALGAVAATVPLPDLGGCAALGEACWTRFTWSFETTRPAFVGEQLTFQVQLVGARAWSFGYEGLHASSFTITPAVPPTTGFDFGAAITSPADGDVLDGGDVVLAGGTAAFPDQGIDPTGAGDHPTDRRIEVSLDDPDFGAPVEASYDASTGEWSAPLRDVGDGAHVVYARARSGEIVSDADSVAFTVRPSTRVEWQIVDRNATPTIGAWQDAAGVDQWSFTFDSAARGSGAHTIVTRLVSDGAVLQQQSAGVKIR